MLKTWEITLLKQVLEEPEIFSGNMGCNDWEWPDYVPEEDRKNACIQVQYWNDEGEMIREDYNGSDEEFYSEEYNRTLSNFTVPFYFRMRLEQEGIL